MTDTDTATLAIEYRPLDSLEPNPSNPKDHDIGGIMESMRRFGFADAPIIDERTGRLVAGHGRADAAAALRDAVERGDTDGAGRPWEPPRWIIVDDDGVWHMPVQTGWSSVDDEEANAALIALNAWTERGGWDMGGLTRLLSELSEHPRGLEGIGYDHDDLDRMLAELHAPMNLDDDDEVSSTRKAVECPNCGHEFYPGEGA